MKGDVITRIIGYEVKVPAKPGMIDSGEVSKPLHKLPVGVRGGWSLQFDTLSKLVLALELKDGLIGWGECYRGHDPLLVSQMAGVLLGKRLSELTLQRMPFAFCREYDGFECAVWDAYARSLEVRVADLLGGPVRERVRVGAWSSHRTQADASEVAARFAGMGYDCIKFKCDLGDDVADWCARIASQAPGMQVILDPNERWGHPYEARKRMDALARVGNVLCLEDPVPRWMLHEYAKLRHYGPIPIVLHVSLPYVLQGQAIKDAIQAIRLDAVDGFNFNCGPANFQRLSKIAEAAELPCWHGSEIDLGILEAMYLHSSAASPACTWPGDIFGRLIREHDLLKKPLRIEPPYAWLPEGPGLGVEPDPKALEHYLVSKKEYCI